jgi:hypothetical protein
MLHTRLMVFALAVNLMPALAGASTSPQTAVLATVHQFIDGLNKNDIKMAFAACASPASIVDEVPPHEWQGPAACQQWLNSYNADNEKNGIVGGPVTLGTPWHVDISADTAYVVLPATYAFTQRGKPMTEAAVLTVALKELASGWRITGWTWSKH